jgi:hypothetical protein
MELNKIKVIFSNGSIKEYTGKIEFNKSERENIVTIITKTDTFFFPYCSVKLIRVKPVK